MIIIVFLVWKHALHWYTEDVLKGYEIQGSYRHFIVRVATVREKYLENDIFPGHGIVREFCEWLGCGLKDLESQGKFREFENKWLWQVVFRKFIYTVQERKGCTFS